MWMGRPLGCGIPWLRRHPFTCCTYSSCLWARDPLVLQLEVIFYGSFIHQCIKKLVKWHSCKCAWISSDQSHGYAWIVLIMVLLLCEDDTKNHLYSFLLWWRWFVNSMNIHLDVLNWWFLRWSFVEFCEWFLSDNNTYI